MKSSAKVKKHQGPQKGQKPLTSFFFTKGGSKADARSYGETTSSPQSCPSAKRVRIEDEKDTGSEVIAIDDSPDAPPSKASPFFRTGADALVESARPAKRAKVEAVVVKVLSTDEIDVPEENSCEEAAHVASKAQLRTIRIPDRIPAQHLRFQNKLVSRAPNNGRTADGTMKQKHTPLELQVQDLKKKHPGILLIFEVGYKFRFFGEDAETAAAICNIFCYPDRNFMTASIPVPRLHIYIRRLVAAGHKVGVVRQTETAALKAAGDNKYAPFTRKLTALYTRATLEAGNKEDIGEGSAEEAGPWSSEGLSSYLVCVTEEEGPAQTDDVEIGLVAVETSTGDVLYSQFRDGMMRGSLEAHLLYATPGELLVAHPISGASQRLLGSFSQAVRGLKAETVRGGKLGILEAAAAVATFYASGQSQAS